MALSEEDKRWISEQLASLEERFSDRLEKVETTLLTEFHKWPHLRKPASGDSVKC